MVEVNKEKNGSEEREPEESHALQRRQDQGIARRREFPLVSKEKEL